MKEIAIFDSGTNSTGDEAASAVLVSQPQAAVPLNAVVLQRQEISPGLIILRVAPDDWEFGEFQPGQFGVLALPGNARRCANSDFDEEPIENPDKLLKTRPGDTHIFS